MTIQKSAFWDDLAADLQDPALLREYLTQSIRIATIDSLMNQLDAARQALGLSKSTLAKAINAEPATVRRLFSASHTNPTVGTVAEIAAALGLRITIEPIPAHEQELLTEPLLTGHTDRPQQVMAEAQRRSDRVLV